MGHRRPGRSGIQVELIGCIILKGEREQTQMLVPAKCKLCKQVKYVAEFQLNPHGCQECLDKLGKGHLFPSVGRGVKKKRIGKNKLAKMQAKLPVGEGADGTQ